MRTKFASFVAVFVLSFLASAVPASAQYGYGGCDRWQQIYYGCDQLRQVMSQNQRLIDYAGRRGYYDGEYFQPVDQYGRPMGPREKVVTGGIIGAGLGYGVGDLIGHPGAGTAIGAGVGALIGVLAGHRNDQAGNGQITVTPPPQPQGNIRWNQGMPVAVGQRVLPSSAEQSYVPLAGPAVQGQGHGEWKLVNQTRFRADVYDGEKPVGFRLNPGEVRYVPAPENGYLAYALIPNTEGRFNTDKMDTKPANDGWTFVEPTFRVKE